jgi:predicted esterase
MPYQEFSFKPCVFSTRAFPEGDFEDPSYVEDLVGSYEAKITYYDANYNLVTTADSPGRYGAVIEVRTDDGQTFKRYRTLFREPKDFSWRNTEIPFTVKLPKEMGISATALKVQQQSVNTYFKELLRDEGVNRDGDTAVLLAGLFETKPGTQARLANSSAAMDRAWWAGLKKKIGEPLYKHLVYLPVGYEEQATKGRRDEGMKGVETAGASGSRTRYPLVLFLHGKGERGDNLVQIKESALPSRLEYDAKFREQFPAIVVAPQCPANEWWSTDELAMLLDEVQTRYRVDPDRLYVTGMSMGGYGTWALASAFPDRFAAIVPVCGGGDLAEVDHLLHLPIWAFHGNKDDVVPIDESQKMVTALQSVGGDVRFTVYPDSGHDAWTDTYANPEVYTWLFSHKRVVGSEKTDKRPLVAGVSAPTTMPTSASH